MSGVIGAGLPIAETKLEDVLDIFGRNLKISLNCVKIGIIQAIDYTTMTASIQLVFQQALRDGTFQAVKVLTDCPVFTPQGGGFSLQFPIAVGDTAIVLFADRNIDNWFTGGGLMPPADGRLHALSDAIALVGLNAMADPLTPAPSASEARLVDFTGETKVGLMGGRITVQNATQSLAVILTSLVTYLAALNTAIAGESAVIPAAAATAAGQEAVIAELIVDLGELLY